MKESGIFQYALYTTYNVNRSQLNRLRCNENVQVNTIDKVCNILRCLSLWEGGCFYTLFPSLENSKNFLFQSLTRGKGCAMLLLY